MRRVRLHAELHRRRSVLRVMLRKARSRARWTIASAIAVRKNMTASTPPFWSAIRSSQALSITQFIPNCASKLGSPGNARRWHMAMTAFSVPITSFSQLIESTPYSDNSRLRKNSTTLATIPTATTTPIIPSDINSEIDQPNILPTDNAEICALSPAKLKPPLSAISVK